MKTITKPDAVRVMFTTRGRIFSVTVRRRTDGKIRRMNVRMYTRSDQREQDDTRNLQVTVIDMQATRRSSAKQYRTIALERVQRLACEGQVYRVV